MTHIFATWVLWKYVCQVFIYFVEGCKIQMKNIFKITLKINEITYIFLQKHIIYIMVECWFDNWFNTHYSRASAIFAFVNILFWFYFVIPAIDISKDILQTIEFICLYLVMFHDTCWILRISSLLFWDKTNIEFRES